MIARYTLTHLTSGSYESWRFRLKITLGGKLPKPVLGTNISACPTCMPSPVYTMRAPTIPHSHTAPYAPRRSPPCTPALPCGPLQLAQRTSITGATIRHDDRTMLQRNKANTRAPDSNGPRASPRYLANSSFPSNNHSTIFLLPHIHFTSGTV